MKTYKVWIEIEEHDDETDEYQNVDSLDFASTGEFSDDMEAERFANRLHDFGSQIIPVRTGSGVTPITSTLNHCFTSEN